MARRGRLGPEGTVFWALVGAALVYIYLPTFRWLISEWLGGGSFGDLRDWSYGPLLVGLGGYGLWRGRTELFGGMASSSWGLILVFAGLGLHMAGWWVGASYLSAYSLSPLLAGMAILFLGARMGHRLIIPMLLLALAVPVPVDRLGIIGLLQGGVATGAAFLAGLAAVPVQRSGLVIEVGNDWYVVEQLCSGFNLIMALLGLVLPLLYLRGSPMKMMLGAVVLLPPLGLAAKVLAVGATLVLGASMGQERALGIYHPWLGIAAFLGALAIAFSVIDRLSHRRPVEPLRLSPV